MNIERMRKANQRRTEVVVTEEQERIFDELVAQTEEFEEFERARGCAWGPPDVG